MKRNDNVIMIIGTIAFFILAYIIEIFIKVNAKLIATIAIAIVIAISLVYKVIKKEKKISTKNIIYLIIILGIIIRAMYISYTPITERQHDVYSIEDQGHLGYIYTIYETGKLPTINSIQFYHPPLFHLIGAGWLKINDICNVSLNASLEGLQVITAIFSSFIMICAYNIVKHVKLKDIYKILIMLVVALHPTFIILSGSINNDILMILLTFMIILYLIKWHKESSIKNTVILAVITGLAVMTKVSAAIMAIPILYTFLNEYFTELKHNKKILNWKFISKMLLFGIISLPIGLWHPIRNLILFNQPIGGVLIPGQRLNISGYSIASRFFTLSIKEFLMEPYAVIPGDHNILAFIIKSSVLGEFRYNNMATLSTMLKLINLIIITASIICYITYIMKIKKDTENKYISKLLLITWFINVISYYYFNVEYPYTCTMDFRYLVPTIFTGISMMCIVAEKFIKNSIIKNIIEYVIVIFCALSLAMFFVI